MRFRNVVLTVISLACLLLIPVCVEAAETEHSFVDGVCTDCGLVGQSYLVLNDNIDIDWTLSQDLYLDLNGFDISGKITTNGFAIYGIDSATKNYLYVNMGHFECVDEAGSDIVPEPFVLTDEVMTGYERRFLTIPTNQGYTFHRFYIGITHTSLKPSSNGLGYKALFCGDDMVLDMLDSDKALGFSLRLGEYAPFSAYCGVGKLTSAEPISLRLENWDVDAYPETPLYASVFLTLADGSVIDTAERSVTMRQIVEAVNTSYQSFSQKQLDAVRALIERNPVMKTWAINNLFIFGYEFVDSPVTGTAYKFGINIDSLNGEYYYFDGSTTSYYLATAGDFSAAPDVYLETSGSGYAVYFLNGGVKTYINVAYRSSSGSSVCLKLSTSSPTVYQLNKQYKYIYTTMGSRTYYLGTYTSSSGTTYTTISASNTSYISNTATIGVTQFPAWFMTPESYKEPDTGDDNIQPPSGDPCQNHTDTDNNGYCDTCYYDVTVVIDFYAVNDLHGKLADADSHPGVDELSTYIENARASRDNVILFSSGDMWQGAAESNLTKGMIITDWMNEMNFVSMTMGNHEYDWGENVIRQNAEFADFPFLAINIYDNETGTQVNYCQSSVVVEADGIQIGIIGAMGDCYSSISPDRTQDVYFLTGSSLTNLVKNEATRLREQGVDFVVLSVHDGYSNYDESLSNGYIDLVFEGHTHQSYVQTDSYGVYHLQGGGDNAGISYASIICNTANGSSRVTDRQVITTGTYSSLPDHQLIAQLLNEYQDIISVANKVLGKLSAKVYSSTILQTVADLYIQAGVEKWGDKYNIVLGGGYLNCRSPYNLEAGDVTYGMLMSILPFDNRLVLCSVSGSNLKSKFINTTNSSYYISYSDYGAKLTTIDNNKTYYIVVDSYTAYYAPNKLTIIDFYDEDVYARDLLAEYIEQGKLK